MRDIGSLFSVNKMLTAECYKARMATDNGLSFLEFTYMLMQSYDFLELFHHKGIDAGLAAGIFHQKLLTIRELKEYLNENGVEMRL